MCHVSVALLSSSGPDVYALSQVAAIRQTVRIVDIHDKQVLRTGDRATVTMEFITRPEQVSVGQKMLFREGKCKGLGASSSCKRRIAYARAEHAFVHCRCHYCCPRLRTRQRSVTVLHLS